MLLHDALLQSECPICLQPLSCVVRPPPQHSRPASPLYDGQPHTASSYASSTTHSPISLPNRSGELETDSGEFRITFAPGVYGTDATDPWQSSPSNNSNNNHSSNSDVHDDGSPANPAATEESASGVVVLPCGHLLHFLCAMQLCGYAEHPSCPVCRTKLSPATDLISFRPRPRAPPQRPTRPPAAASTQRLDLIVNSQSSEGAVVVEDDGEGGLATRKRNREINPDSFSYGQRLDVDENSSSVTVIADDDAAGSASRVHPSAHLQLLGGSESVYADDVEEDFKEQHNGDVNSDSAPALGALIEPVPVASESPPPPPPPSLMSPCATTAGEKERGVQTSARTPAAAQPRRSTPPSLQRGVSEDEIQIVGARQLPPSQAYAELLLRSTTTWADRTDTLKTRVAHLEKSQQQLQSDCAELDRTLSAARRRREVLLNVPSAAPMNAEDATGALPSFERLRELRRLCQETRLAMSDATAQLASSTRENAELRRQVDKYTRKLARLGSGGEGEEEKEKTGDAMRGKRRSL